jgi:hypothetical protein
MLGAQSQPTGAQTMALNLTAPGSTPAERWDGGTGHFSAVGTFGGSTVGLEFCPDASFAANTFYSVGPEVTETSPGGGLFEAGMGFLRMTMTGGAGQNVDGYIRRV